MKKKILIALYYYTPYISWLTIYAKNLAENLVKNGYEVTIYCAKHDKNLLNKEIINWVTIIRENILWNLWKWVLMPFFWFKTTKMARNFDIVNFHLPNADLWLSSLFIDKNKLFITYHCDINLGKWFVNKVIEKISFFLMNIAMKRAKKIIWNSKDYFLSSYFKKYIFKFEEITPPIDFTWIEKWEKTVDIKISENTFNIWFLGRIVYEKWINFLLEAILLNPLKNKNFHLYIGWDYKNIMWWSIMWELSDLIEKTKDKVTFLGNINSDQLKDFYNKIDVLVLPSFDPLESFWMVQLEAMFNNTPVIASDMPWVNSVVKNTWFWYLTKIKNSQDLSEKISKMLDKKEKYENLKNDNILKNTILEKYSVEKVTEKYITVFNQ